MGAVLRAVADDLIKAKGYDDSPAEIIRVIDRAITASSPLTLYSERIDLKSILPAGQHIIDEAAQTLRNKVGSGAEIDVIVMTGGGAALYEGAVRKLYPRHKVITLKEPTQANVRGFHLMGEKLAQSMFRSAPKAVAA
jgi:plasmid segregation protein ParM